MDTNNDPFNIKVILTDLLMGKNVDSINELIEDINYYATENLKLAQNILVDLFAAYDLKSIVQEYENLRKEDP